MAFQHKKEDEQRSSSCGLVLLALVDLYIANLFIDDLETLSDGDCSCGDLFLSSLDDAVGELPVEHLRLNVCVVGISVSNEEQINWFGDVFD